MERSEVGSEEETFMEILDSESVYFGAEYKKFSTNYDSGSSITSTNVESTRSCTTAEEIINDRRRRSYKKQRKEVSAYSPGTIKGRKDKLGDKISALQQLVSPFCKSDTATVLHEAQGYIRFLHDQVQALSSPYLLQRLPTTTAAGRPKQEGDECEDQSGAVSDLRSGGDGCDDQPGAARDLRSRGLCLVPIACTAKVAKGKGAD